MTLVMMRPDRERVTTERTNARDLVYSFLNGGEVDLARVRRECMVPFFFPLFFPPCPVSFLFVRRSSLVNTAQFISGALSGCIYLGRCLLVILSNLTPHAACSSSLVEHFGGLVKAICQTKKSCRRSRTIDR